MKENCKDPFVHPHIKIGGKAPFQVTVATNVVKGYKAEFCYVCWNKGYSASTGKAGGKWAAENTEIVVAGWINPDCPKPGSKIMEIKQKKYG